MKISIYNGLLWRILKIRNKNIKANDKDAKIGPSKINKLTSDNDDTGRYLGEFANYVAKEVGKYLNGNGTKISLVAAAG